MNRHYLGDSYDAVKRLWQEVFQQWAPLHAEPRFIPQEIRAEFSAFTRIPILGSDRPSYYAIFNDPDTGIRHPGQSNQRESRSHISLDTIKAQVRIAGVRSVITFDQTSHRNLDLSRKEQRAAKLQWLGCHRIPAFYYVSHAPFLFAFSGAKHMTEALRLLQAAGFPDERIEGAGET